MPISSGVRYALREASSWLCAAAIMIAGVIYFDEIKAGALAAFGLPAGPDGVITAPTQAASTARPASANGITVELKSGRNGHFHTSATINGRDITVMVDTGASIVALTYEDAERAGIFVRPADYTHQVSTANGIARIAPVMLDRVQIGDITVRNVRAAVSERGKLATTLLGMTFLGRLSRTEMRQGTLILQE